MDSSVRGEGPEAQQTEKRSFLSLSKALSIIKWLVTLVHLTEAEQEEAGIHIEHQGGT